MKKLLLIFCIMGMGKISFSQTNTFPSTGNVGIGTNSPSSELDIRGSLTFEAGGDPLIYTGISNDELNRYLELINSKGSTNASGLKAGGILIADVYSYANPGKNDLVVKGKVGIGTSSPVNALSLIEGGASPYSNDGTTILQLKRNTSNGSSSGRTAINISNNSNAFLLSYGGTSDRLSFIDGDSIEVMSLLNGGNVGIGTTSPNEKLSVNGKIRAKEIKVETSGWSDFVFESSYKLPDLKETEAFIKENKHLPEIPSAKEVAENGINLGEMNAKLLQKIEELTLYLIESKKEVKDLQERVKVLEGKK